MRLLARQDGGKMSQYFEKLKIGDSITLQGPFGSIEYKVPVFLQYLTRV